MFDHEKSQVREHAGRFRAALEGLAGSCGYAGLAAFPLGSCGDAVPLLGAYLIDVNVGAFDYIHGERGRQAKGDWRSHAWLRCDDLIVDITADQFDDLTIPVVVTRDDSWYRVFRTENRGLADFRRDACAAPKLAAIYKLLIQEIARARQVGS